MLKKIKMQDLSRVRDKKLGIYKNEIGTNENGYPIESQVLVREVWGKVRGIRGKEFYEAKQTQALDIKTFNFGYFEGLSAEHYILYKDEFYNIESVDNIDEANFEYEVRGKVVNPSE